MVQRVYEKPLAYGRSKMLFFPNNIMYKAASPSLVAKSSYRTRKQAYFIVRDDLLLADMTVVILIRHINVHPESECSAGLLRT